MKKGDRIKDNDPRVGKRVLVIMDDNARSENGPSVRAVSIHGGRDCYILKRRIFEDDKERRYGFNLVRKAP